jgi:hypothetical protein
MAKLQTVRRVEPRVYPVGRAVVLHGFGEPDLAGRRYSIEGRRVQSVLFGRLALLIAYVDQAGYAPVELERRRDDRTWLSTEARFHERVAARASAHGAFVPARLLNVFPHRIALDEAAAEYGARWSRSLTKFADKREFALHVFAGPHAAPGGESYLLRVAAHASRTVRRIPLKASDAIVAQVGDLWRGCARHASAVRRVEGVPARGLLGSSVYLVAEREAESVPLLVTKAAIAGAELGLTYYLEGPRAPFSFV